MFMSNKFYIATLTWRAFEKLSIDDRELPRDITWYLSFRIWGTVYKWRKKCFRSYLPPPYPPKKFVTGPVYEKFQSYHITSYKLYRKKRKHHRTFPAEIMTRLRRPEKNQKSMLNNFRGVFFGHKIETYFIAGVGMLAAATLILLQKYACIQGITKRTYWLFFGTLNFFSNWHFETHLFKQPPAPLTHRSKIVMSLTGAHWHPTNILVQKCYFTHFFKMFRFYMKWVFGSEPLSPRDDKDLRIICHSLSKSTTGEKT